MTGEYQHSLDAKGRLFIPARLRDELATRSTSRCRTSAASGPTAPRAAELCGQGAIHALCGPQKDAAVSSPARRSATLTAQGRALLPQALRGFCRTDKKCNRRRLRTTTPELWDMRYLEACAPGRDHAGIHRVHYEGA